MKNFKLHHKIFAIVLATAFAFQSMPEINDHTYTLGIDNFHYSNSCVGISLPSHLSNKCPKINCGNYAF